MKGGMQFADDNDPEYGNISLYGNSNGDEQKNLQFKKKEVQTHSKLKDGNHLSFNLYNIESFYEYEQKTFDLSKLDDDINSIEHLYLCGFLTKWDRKELFIKKGKVGEEGNKEENKASNKAKHFKAIGETLYKLSKMIKKVPDKITYKIQIILAHSTEKKALCIIFNMSNIDERYYDLLKEYLLDIDTLFSDDKILEGKIEPSQLENLIEFTNEKLVIGPDPEIPKSKIRFLLGLLFSNAKVEATETVEGKNVLQLEKKLKAKLSYNALLEKFTPTQIEEAFDAASIDKKKYETLTDKLGQVQSSSSGGGKKKKLIRGGALTPEDQKIFKIMLESLEKTDTKKKYDEFFKKNNEDLLQYESMVSTKTPAESGSAQAVIKEEGAAATEQEPAEPAAPAEAALSTPAAATANAPAPETEANKLKLKTQFLLKLLFSILPAAQAAAQAAAPVAAQAAPPAAAPVAAQAAVDSLGLGAVRDTDENAEPAAEAAPSAPAAEAEAGLGTTAKQAATTQAPVSGTVSAESAATAPPAAEAEAESAATAPPAAEAVTAAAPPSPAADQQQAAKSEPAAAEPAPVAEPAATTEAEAAVAAIFKDINPIIYNMAFIVKKDSIFDIGRFNLRYEKAKVAAATKAAAAVAAEAAAAATKAAAAVAEEAEKAADKAQEIVDVAKELIRAPAVSVSDGVIKLRAAKKAAAKAKAAAAKAKEAAAKAKAAKGEAVVVAKGVEEATNAATKFAEDGDAKAAAKEAEEAAIKKTTVETLAEKAATAAEDAKAAAKEAEEAATAAADAETGIRNLIFYYNAPL